MVLSQACEVMYRLAGLQVFFHPFNYGCLIGSRRVNACIVRGLVKAAALHLFSESNYVLSMSPITVRRFGDVYQKGVQPKQSCRNPKPCLNS